jgi:hypothetical protein
LRGDVAEGEAAVVFVDDVGGDLAIDDAGEDGGHAGRVQWQGVQGSGIRTAMGELAAMLGDAIAGFMVDALYL